MSTCSDDRSCACANLTRVQPLQAGVRLTAIFDSCHSGSALDLPYIYSTQGVLKEPNLAKEAGQGLLSIVSSYARGDMGGMASSAMGLFKKVTSGNDSFERNIRTKTSSADVIMWSGSKDDQTSYVNFNFPDEPEFVCFALNSSPTLENTRAQSHVAYRDLYGAVLT